MQAARVAGMSTPTSPTSPCDQCGAALPSVQDRPNGSRECLPCWRASLQHGHAQGLHTDSEADPSDPVLDDCPDCPGQAERVRRAAAAAAAGAERD